MSLKDKLKQFINVTDDTYVEGAEQEYADDFDYVNEQAYQPEPEAAPQPQPQRQRMRDRAPAANVVDISSKPAAGAAKSHVVIQKIDSFDEVGVVADILNEKRIVILNLETCPNDESQRIIDFLYGVAYANHGVFKKVAGGAYIITPYNVPVSGELLDELVGEVGE